MPSADETEIQGLLCELIETWRLGDAKAYGARYLPDGTFTNVNGGFYVGREEFDLRHDDIFRGVFKGTTLPPTIRTLRFVRSLTSTLACAVAGRCRRDSDRLRRSLADAPSHGADKGSGQAVDRRLS